MSGWMPGAIRKGITPGVNDPAITPIGVIYHVAVSMNDSLWGYFAHRSNGIESHFYVRLDGTIEQYRSIYFEADAQSAGNSFMRDGKRCGFVSVETEGMGEGTWTDAQIASLKAITLFVNSESPFNLRVCPGPISPGVGYHCLFSGWNPNSHSCPGPERIKQFNDIIPAWLAAGAGAPNEEIIDMDEKDLRRLVRQESALGAQDMLNRELWDAYKDPAGKQKMSHILLRTDLGVRVALGLLNQQAESLVAELKAQFGDVAADLTADKLIDALADRLSASE